MHSRAVGGVAHLPVAGVDAGGKALSGGDAGEQGSELATLVVAQGRSDIALMTARELTEFSQDGPPVVGELEGVLAPVGRAALPANQAALLEAVDEPDYPTGQQAEPGSQLLLATAAVLADRAQQAGLRRGQVQGSDALGEATRRVGP